jgi:signal transduction histidine kinase
MPKEALHIMGDKNHLIRVFNDLVINAIQAIPSDREGRINVAVLNQNGLAVIKKISDNGGGIPPEIRDRVFEPNFTTKTSGSGLGLAICKGLLRHTMAISGLKPGKMKGPTFLWKSRFRQWPDDPINSTQASSSIA